MADSFELEEIVPEDEQEELPEAARGTLQNAGRALKGYLERGNIEEAKRRVAVISAVRQYYGQAPIGVPQIENGKIYTNDELQAEGIETIDYTPEHPERIPVDEDNPSETVSDVQDDRSDMAKLRDNNNRANVVTHDPKKWADAPDQYDFMYADDAGYASEDENNTATDNTRPPEGVGDAPSKADAGTQRKNALGRFIDGFTSDLVPDDTGGDRPDNPEDITQWGNGGTAGTDSPDSPDDDGDDLPDSLKGGQLTRAD